MSTEYLSSKSIEYLSSKFVVSTQERDCETFPNSLVLHCYTFKLSRVTLLHFQKRMHTGELGVVSDDVLCPE